MKQKCLRCKKVKPLDRFTKVKGCLNGRARQCKDCGYDVGKKRNGKKCSRCDNGIILNSGAYSLCEKHLVFFHMRKNASKTRKYTPSYEELDLLLEKQGVVCYLCKTEMAWRSNNNRKVGISLQHDNNGEIRFLCNSCNVRHGRGGLGDKIYELGMAVKICTFCKIIKPRSDFYRRRKWLQPQCKKCRSIINNRITKPEKVK